mgnify:CR=1 FL=1
MTVTKKRRKRKKRYHTGVYASTKTGQLCKYRSGWELSYLHWLDASPDVATFVYEGVKIPYVSNVRTKKIRNYYPDFWVTRVDGTMLLVEIKPKKRLQQANVRKKLAAAADWCRAHGAVLTVLTEVELRVMGLV